ncbi:hypothetical protein Adi01nite_72630 [Amorphoplanes digitatis]|nr:hypothetical protein Adi01nite_72630 [Actinoplanes digitatis]
MHRVHNEITDGGDRQAPVGVGHGGAGRHGHTYQDRTSECGSRERDAQWTHEIPRIDRRHRRGQPSLIFAQKDHPNGRSAPVPSQRLRLDAHPRPARLLPSAAVYDSGWVVA